MSSSKSSMQTVMKHGVLLHRRWYVHPDFVYYRGKTVEVYYTEDNYLDVDVIFPDGRVVCAQFASFLDDAPLRAVSSTGTEVLISACGRQRLFENDRLVYNDNPAARFVYGDQ